MCSGNNYGTNLMLFGLVGREWQLTHLACQYPWSSSREGVYTHAGILISIYDLLLKFMQGTPRKKYIDLLQRLLTVVFWGPETILIDISRNRKIMHSFVKGTYCRYRILNIKTLSMAILTIQKMNHFNFKTFLTRFCWLG